MKDISQDHPSEDTYGMRARRALDTGLQCPLPMDTGHFLSPTLLAYWCVISRKAPLSSSEFILEVHYLVWWSEPLATWLNFISCSSGDSFHAVSSHPLAQTQVCSKRLMDNKDTPITRDIY